MRRSTTPRVTVGRRVPTTAAISWEDLVRERENFSLVITGHQYDERDGMPYQFNVGDNGNAVYQMLVDQQNRAFGGEGWIRLLEFSPDGTTVTVKSYSPYLNQWSYASDEYFTIQLSPLNVPEPATLWLAGVAVTALGWRRVG